jgi:hypothetical protein
VTEVAPRRRVQLLSTWMHTCTAWAVAMQADPRHARVQVDDGEEQQLAYAHFRYEMEGVHVWQVRWHSNHIP